MGLLIPLEDRRFGRLTVVERAENDKAGKPQWLCRCLCGQEVVVAGLSLRSGSTHSCGCLRREIMRKMMHERNHVAPDN